jgi:hypothetical protein
MSALHRPPLRRLLDLLWCEGPEALQPPAVRALLDELSDESRRFVEAFAEGIRRGPREKAFGVGPGPTTRSPDKLPDIPSLQRLGRALATLDAILCPEWHNRYYSYNARWAPGAECASMQNGEGEYLFVHFSAAGALIKGFAHDYVMSPWTRLTASHHGGQPGKGLWPGLVEQVPPAFEAALREPAFDWDNTTFCLWREADAPSWRVGPIDFPAYMYLIDDGSVDVFVEEDPDGSSFLLELFDGDPRTYKEFADHYFSAAGNGYPLDAIEAIYRLAPLDAALVRRLNPERDLASLAEDVNEIGYPGGLVGFPTASP